MSQLEIKESGTSVGRQLPDVTGTPDFFSRFVNKTATPINGTPIHLFQIGGYGSRANGASLSPPPLAFSPSPTKLADHGSPNSSFCHPLNLNDCISYINQELSMLGLGSILDSSTGNLDIVRLVNGVHGLLAKYQGTMRVREELENRQRRNESDIENLQLAQQRLKESLSQKERDLQQAVESERQMKEKVKRLTELLKAEKDEVRRLNSIIQHKDAQYKHELKKKEREQHKLKENLQSRRMERNSERKAGIEISETLQRGEGKRARWKTQESHDDDLYRTVILDYEEKQKDLLTENAELRQCLKNLEKEITNATCQPNMDNSLSLNDSDNMSDHLDSISLLSLKSDNEISEGLFEMPFHMVRDSLQKVFKSKLKIIRLMNKQLYRQGEPDQTVPNRHSPNLEKQDKEISRLKSQVDRYRHVIQQQEQFIQDRLETGSNDSMDSSMLRDSYLYDEYDALERERRMLRHQQALLREEKDYISNAKKQLAQQQCALDEQTTLAKHQFFEITPFQNRQKSHMSSVQKTKPRRQRLLPSTPRFASSPAVPKTPSTNQLYKFLGLKQRTAKYNENSDSEDTQSNLDCSSTVSSLGAPLFSPPPSDGSRNLTPNASPLTSARINEHKENIKTLMQRNRSPSSMS